MRKPGGMGLARIVEIDTTGGPRSASSISSNTISSTTRKSRLTFDDGPGPGAGCAQALTDECLKAT
jgi:hypothetical protein